MNINLSLSTFLAAASAPALGLTKVQCNISGLFGEFTEYVKCTIALACTQTMFPQACVYRLHESRKLYT